jgi:hypothetical protein
VKITKTFNMGLQDIHRVLYLYPMVPDYPYKTFGDERRSYCLLMEVLAMGPQA